MNKSLIIAIIILCVIIAAGVLEITFISSAFEDMGRQTQTLLENAQAETLNLNQFDAYKHNWINLRCQTELFLPHMDVYEINYRIAELGSYIETGDFDMAHAQLTQIADLVKYIPHLMVPSWQHIL